MGERENGGGKMMDGDVGRKGRDLWDDLGGETCTKSLDLDPESVL